VPEQLALDELGGNRRAVDLDECLVATRGGLVQRTGHQLLAGSVLAGDEHPRRGRPDLGHQLAHALERRAAAHHLIAAPRGFPQAGVLPHELGVRQRVPHREEEPVRVERLLQEVEGASLRGFDGGGDGPVPGDHHDLRTRVEVPEPGERLQPVEARHLDVQEDQMWPELGVEADRLAARSGDPHLEIFVLQDLLQRLANALLVVNDQHPVAHDGVVP
jgi:hypothetical protein